MTLFEKLFIDGTWHIAFRRRPWSWPVDYDIPFQEIKGEKGFWYADPLPFDYKGEVFLFCEAFNEKRQAGEIAVFTFDGQNWVNPRVIISENYHMSYPCVFSYGDDVYMIPESQEARTLELYKADRFPYKWSKVTNLLNNVVLADPTVWQYNGIYYMVCYKNIKPFSLQLYQLDLSKLGLKLINELSYEANTGRPAGRLISYNNGLLRPSQDCREMYGRSVIWNYITIDGSDIKESTILRTVNSNINIENLPYMGVDRVHTFSVSEVGGRVFIEYKIHCFSVVKICRNIWRRYKRLKREKDNSIK